MPTYHDILAAGALRVDALVGAQAAALQTTYVVRPLTSANFQSAVFTFSDLKAGIGWAEQQMALAIGQTGNETLQSYIRSTTANIANGAVLPGVDLNGVPIIGTLGAIKDATVNRVCFPMPLSEVQRRVDNPHSTWVVDVFYYALEGPRVFHTRDNVKIDVSIYDADAQMDAIDANDDILFPPLENMYIWGMLGTAIRDDEFSNQATIYRGYFDDGLAALRKGLASVSEKTMAIPA